jgi:hypothetical protein
MKPLSVDEILGNIFVFNFAGHDTTAISLAYSVLLLVDHPEVQDWVAEELMFYLDADRGGIWRYETVFPKLKRCLAILVRIRCAADLFPVDAYPWSSSRLCGCTILSLESLNILVISVASSELGTKR